MDYGKIKQCIRNLFRIGIKTSDGTPNDSGKLVTVNIECMGKVQEALLFIPWGIHVKLPNQDVLAAIWQQEAHEDSLVTSPSDITNVDTLTGEQGLAFGIPSLKERIIFKDTEIIVFKTGDTEGGDYAVRFNKLQTAFDELKDDFNDLVVKYNVLVGFFNGHVHGGVEAGSSDTGAVSGTANTDSPSAADITPAKILEIEMPGVSP
jgi:hypothetical protein